MGVRRLSSTVTRFSITSSLKSATEETIRARSPVPSPTRTIWSAKPGISPLSASVSTKERPSRTSSAVGSKTLRRWRLPTARAATGIALASGIPPPSRVPSARENWDTA